MRTELTAAGPMRRPAAVKQTLVSVQSTDVASPYNGPRYASGTLGSIVRYAFRRVVAARVRTAFF